MNTLADADDYSHSQLGSSDSGLIQSERAWSGTCRHMYARRHSLNSMNRQSLATGWFFLNDQMSSSIYDHRKAFDATPWQASKDVVAVINSD